MKASTIGFAPSISNTLTVTAKRFGWLLSCLLFALTYEFKQSFSCLLSSSQGCQDSSIFGAPHTTKNVPQDLVPFFLAEQTHFLWSLLIPN